MEFHELANIFPMMTDDEMAALVESMKQGYDSKFPIITYEGKILDGRNRYTACTFAGVEPVYTEWEGDDPVSFVVRANLERRHLSSSQKAMIALDIERSIAVRARENQGTRNDLFQFVEKSPEPIQAAKEAAKLTGTNHQYVVDAKTIQAKAPDIAERVRAGELTIPKAKAEINRRERADFMQGDIDIRVPDGKYRTIVIDPPWHMEKILREVAPNQAGFEYPTMTLDEIKAFDVPAKIADDDCHLFMWTTQKYLPEAFDVLEAWGFKYVFCMVWHKNGGFQPFNLPQYNCEFVVYGRKGSPDFIDLKAFPTCFNAPRREHSRKPDEFYQLVERVCASPRIDIFSREKRSGFDQYGNETDKFME